MMVRNLLTSLVLHGQVTTSEKKAKVLKSAADSFFSRLVNQYAKYEDEKDAKRENDNYVKSRITSKVAGKKVIDQLVPKYRKADQKSFVANYKVGFRPGDAAMKVLVKLL